jgi:TolB-like protein/tetratricopeptide (TPR) repeat protein
MFFRAPPAASIVRFGLFQFDLRSRELWKQGIPIRLTDQPSRILTHLLQKPGEVVIREELRLTLWASDTHVNYEQGLNAAVKRLRHALGDAPENPVFIETIARRGYRFIAPVTPPQGTGDAAYSPLESVRSIAVLPFHNATRDPEADSVIDGLMDAAIHALSRLAAVRVLARSMVLRYRSQELDHRVVGRKLGVDAILSGRVSRRGEELVVGTELVDVASGWLLWGEQFSRDTSDLRLIERELFVRISQHLHSHAGPSASGVAVRSQTVSPGAYQDYLKGRYHWSKMDVEGMRKSVAYFESALQKDALFAPAHAGLADACNMLAFAGLCRPIDVMAKVKQAAVTAVDLDPDLAEGHTALANALKLYDHDWDGAERQYIQALQLNSNYVPAYRGYAALLAIRGRAMESAAQIGRAYELDPLSLPVGIDMAWNALAGRNYQLAIDYAERTAELEPASRAAQYVLGLAYEQMRRFDEARAALERSLAGGYGHVSGLAGLGHLCAISGKNEEALRTRYGLRELARRQYVAPFWHAVVSAGLGDEEAVVAELQRGFEECDLWLVWLNADPRFDPVRTAPAFRELLRRIGFHEASAPRASALVAPPYR